MSRVSVGVVFLSLGGTPELIQMTQDAIDSCVADDAPINFEVVVCESIAGVEYTGATTVHPQGTPFNYNGYMNSCRTLPEFDDCEYIALCNNDLIFEKGWASALIKKMKECDVMSACPMDPTVHADVKFEEGVCRGHSITRHPRQIAGWCIFQDLRIYDTIKALDTQAQFWHADTAYASQLVNLNLPHILVEDSKVRHLNSKTISSSLISPHVRESYTTNSPTHIQICHDQQRIEKGELT